MASGLTSAYVNGLYTSPSTMPDLDAGAIAVVLWGDANAGTDAPTVTELQTIATSTYASAQTAWGAGGGAAEDDSHVFYLTYVAGTTATASAYVFDATDPTTMTTPITGASEAKDLSIWNCPTAATVANLGLPLAYFDLTTTVTPNGQNIIINWDNSGIWQFGAAV